MGELPMGELPSWIHWSCKRTLADVIALKLHLLRVLPVELVNIILSFAEYWPHVSSLSFDPYRLRGKQWPVSPPLDPRGRRCSLPEFRTGNLRTAIFYNDTLLCQSAPLGLPQQNDRPLLVPKLQHPARMLVVQVRARQVRHGCPRQGYAYFRQVWSTWLEIGVVNHTLPFPRPRPLSHPSLAEREIRNVLLRPNYHKQGEAFESSKLLCESAYYTWFNERSIFAKESHLPGSLRIKLFLDDFHEGQSVIFTSVYRFDEEDHTNHACSGLLNREWEIDLAASHEFSKESQMEFIKYVKKLEDVDKSDGAEFVRGLQVGDEVGVWGRGLSHGIVDDIGDVAVIEDVKVSVFWEA